MFLKMEEWIIVINNNRTIELMRLINLKVMVIKTINNAMEPINQEIID